MTLLSAVLILSGMGCGNKEAAKTGDDKLIGGQKDAGGCLIGAGYGWCVSKKKCLRVWEERCEESKDAFDNNEAVKSATKALETAFAKRESKKTSEVKVNLSWLVENYAVGGIKFAPFSEYTTGGLFYAYRKNGEWQIAWAGNGNVPCADLRVDGFPQEMIADNCAN